VVLGQLAFDAHILERDRGPIYIIGPLCCPVFRGLSFAGSALFSELLDIGCAKATAISRAPLSFRPSSRNTACGKSRQAFDSGCSTAATRYCAGQCRRPPGYGRKW
jgi:hypothetical protein